MEGDDEDRPFSNAAKFIASEFKSVRDKIKSDDDDEFSGKHVFQYLFNLFFMF